MSHLREFGVGRIVQCSRPSDARLKLELGTYDLVVCEQHFDAEDTTGQELLDDLRQNCMLPFFTIFVIVTSQATYSKVAEAAESALDAYLIKPHTSTALTDRIALARDRKIALHDIFDAIDRENYREAARLCKQRFDARGPYWLHAARIGAELMLRIGEFAQAQSLYEAVANAKTLPWARLGIARVQMANAEPEKAVSTLQKLVDAQPGYSDAYDIMARAQFEMGDFRQAMETFKLSTRLTPSSVSRLLKHGLMAYYVGEREEGIELLERAIQIGQESKLFDPQAWVLAAFSKLDAYEPKGLNRCRDGLRDYCERHPEKDRAKRLLETVQTMVAIQDHQIARALDDIRFLHKQVLDPAFDFEAACNLLSLMTRLAIRSIQLYEVEAAVDTMGLRFASSKALTQLLCCAVAERQDFAKRIQQGFDAVSKWSEEAMTLCLDGKPQAAVEKLLTQGKGSCNAKLIESAQSVLDRYRDDIENYDALKAKADDMREKYRTNELHAGLGDLPITGRSAGGISLPTSYKPSNRKGLLATRDEADSQNGGLWPATTGASQG
ncbi:tetratricopeptide repeat protein [Hydrogenophaga sp. 5NK40-0174]|uniref:tetratricopeptide repeat protein n=1 Tax=Hydrogenophaga sp. 5NK40-0174 TaxID=3127649 RepID=UPI00333E3896